MNQPNEYKVNADRTAAVSTDVEFLPMSSCPRAVKVILLGAGGVATIGEYKGPTDTFWEGWFPLMKKRRKA